MSNYLERIGQDKIEDREEIEQLTARVRELEEELERKMSAGQYVLEQLSAAQEEIGGWKKDQKENMDIIFKQQGEINELRAQLAAAQEEIVFASKDSLRLLETVKYLRGIAERGEVREQSEDETVEQFVLGYVKKLEDQLAEAEQRVAEWQPISTAPKDGTVFLGYKLGQFRECYKVPRDDCDMWCFGGTSGADDLFPNIKPTHWMPLPKAPNGASS